MLSCAFEMSVYELVCVRAVKTKTSGNASVTNHKMSFMLAVDAGKSLSIV